jgi:calcium-dependent protein kinase
MGSFCSIGTEIEKPKKLQFYNTIQDIKFNTGLFIQENCNTFSSIYSLVSFPVGYGSYGEVWVCDHIRSKEKRAVKIIDKIWISQEMIEKRTVLNEVDILKTLDHPNVLKVFEYFEDEQYYYIVMEYCKEGDLYDDLLKVEKYDEITAAKIMKQIFSGLAYIHKKNVVHRDVKLDNILITEKNEEIQIKIIDFNIATFNLGKRLSKFTGTLSYIAPEVIKGNYSEKCDLWSCGVIMYLLLSGKFPFEGDSKEDTIKKISCGNFNTKCGQWSKISESAKDLLSKLLQKKPSKRYSAIQALAHPWIEMVNPGFVDEKYMKKTLTRMFSIVKEPKLKEVFKTFILGQVTKNNCELKMLEKVFYSIDKDRNGVISKDELICRLKIDMNEEDAYREAERVLSVVDCDKNGEIDYTEYLRAAIEQESYVCKENLRKAFYYFDKDRSEYIEKQELMAWLSEGAVIPMAVIEELIEEADKNRDGVIDFEEFENLLLEKIEQSGRQSSNSDEEEI